MGKIKCEYEGCVTKNLDGTCEFMSIEGCDAPYFARMDEGPINKLNECKKCKKINGKYDRCIGNLAGVKNACCGHGEDFAYIHFQNGLVIRGIIEEYPVSVDKYNDEDWSLEDMTRLGKYNRR